MGEEARLAHQKAAKARKKAGRVSDKTIDVQLLDMPPIPPSSTLERNLRAVNLARFYLNEPLVYKWPPQRGSGSGSLLSRAMSKIVPSSMVSHSAVSNPCFF